MKQCLRLTEKNIYELLVVTEYIRLDDTCPNYTKQCGLKLEQKLRLHSDKYFPKVFEQLNQPRPVSLEDIL